MQDRVDRRRTDTRRRVRSIAVELFTEQGYELTPLTRIADRAGITRQAVLHHFASKEELLTSAWEELLPELDAIIELARAEPPGAATRMRTVDRLDALVRGEHGAALVCAQVNEHALRGLPAAQTLLSKLVELTRVLATGQSPEGRMRGRLAVSAIVMASARRQELGGRKAERHEAALTVARSLVGPQEQSPEAGR
jgi:AcrR family transcriptional regulator